MRTYAAALRGPMHLCVCVREERGDVEGAGSQALSDTLRFINLAGLALGLVALRGTMHLCVCVREERGESAGARQHTSAYVSIRLECWYSTVRCPIVNMSCGIRGGSIRQHTSAYVSIRQHTSPAAHLHASESEVSGAHGTLLTDIRRNNVN
jgi:hypothetical protein